MPYVTDAHALVWYFIESPRLSKKALEIFEDSAAGVAAGIVKIVW
jgi:PIN domain nuclease of toxin-antitoxin system